MWRYLILSRFPLPFSTRQPLFTLPHIQSQASNVLSFEQVRAQLCRILLVLETSKIAVFPADRPASPRLT